MKTLKTLGLFLLMTTGVLAQINPDDMFISGYVQDSNGQAVANQEVCVTYFNSPLGIQDTICSNTNANGYYTLTVINGSLTGPNVTFDVSTYDPCSLLPQVQTRQNFQGSIDTANVNFSICATGSGNCGVSFTASNDSTGGANGLWTFTANPTGTAPFTYNWWVDGASYSTQTVTHNFNGGIVGVYVTVTDADSCQAFTGDTLFLDGNPNQNCSANIVVLEDSSNAVLNAELIAIATGVAPFTYSWSTGATTESIYLEDIIGLDTVCVEITDATGCTSTLCDVVGFVPNPGCNADFTYQYNNPNATIAAGDPVQFNYSGSQSLFNYYFWTVQGAGSTMNSFDQNPSFTFPAAGSYNICLEVYDSIANCADTYCETITVLSGSVSCQAEFSWYEDSLLGNGFPAVVFSDESQDAVYWFWDFGDNTTSTDQNPFHVYNSAGTYGVCLTIVNADQSCQQTYCDTVVVGNVGTGGCDASFSNSGPTPIGYTFSANVQNNGLYYEWTIDNQYVGDGFEALAPGLATGVHTICLTVIDSLNNCSDTQCQTITVGSNNCFGYISGQLYAGSSNQPVDEGVVYLIAFDANTNQLTAVDSMLVDSGNYYFFGPLVCGEYFIKGAANAGSQYYGNHIPTYYGNSPFWSFAQTITLGQVNAQVTADVFLIASSNPGGPGFIGGNVSQGANKTDPGDPLGGMQVILFDLSGNAIGYTYTDGNGEFGFSNLAYGSYQVYVEQLGVDTDPAYVSIGPDQPSVDNLQIFASETLISTGINEFDFEGAISEVYPNPVGSDASINFNLETEVLVSINVLDLTGRTISTASRSISSGENQVRLDVDGLTEGYYFLNVQDADGAFSVTRKFMRVD